MASSDDEEEALPSSVENYYFEDDGEDPVSLSDLPVQWSASEGPGDDEPKIFLHGDADMKRIKIYKQVVAWRFDFSNVKPEIAVLLKEKRWIKLEKPRKSYEGMVRSILVTVNCLHFVARNLEQSGKSLWDSLAKDYGSFEVRPSESDLVEHISLISEAVKRDNALAKSKFLAEFLKEKPGKRKLPAEETKAKPMSQFIVSDSDDDDMIDGGEGDESDEDDGMFDSVCAICDNGGDLLCCDGSCLRSFHPSVDDDSDCVSLGLTKEEVQATPQFLCKNCEYKQHQCYACGKLGSSDKYSGAEVFQCVSATCGYFFHPRCVAKLIHEDNKCSAEELEQKIKAGESFTCPAHKCRVCKQGENKKDRQLQFALCRRCPNSYHRKCLPKEIPYEDDNNEGVTRAWEDLLPNRILIYCLKHEIDEDVGTPSRDHIKFPGVEEKKSISAKRKAITEEKRPKQTSGMLGDKKKIATKTETPRQERKASEFKQTKKPSPALKVEARDKSGKLGFGSSSSRKVKVHGSVKMEPRSTGADKKKQSLGSRLFAESNKDSELAEANTSDDELHKAVTVPIDPDSKKRVLDIMKSTESSISIEKIKAKLRVPSTHGTFQKHFEERTITVGKVETSVKAVKAALERFQKGGTREDAEAVCGPDLLQKIHRWRNKLKLYVAPFLHGMRYTSFGRHFTQPEKLQEIANKLHCYVQDGDMVVDFCCGSNDFSILMKSKLGEVGKKNCLFKNYDIMPTANDFNFERKDWGKVKPEDLPKGSKLIMGLNPPFGIKGALANVFIDKALEFNPKLLILIAPVETERLEKKKTPYDLVWEDNNMLAGKSFYLPGSTDVKDKLIAQWNIKPPQLCLWSHPDWTAVHRKIAENQGHIPKHEEERNTERRPGSPDRPIDTHNQIHDYPLDGNNDCANMEEDEVYGDDPAPKDNPVEADHLKGYEPEGQHKVSSAWIVDDGEIHGSRGPEKRPFDGDSRKRARSQSWDKKSKRRESDRVSTEQNYGGGDRASGRDFHSQSISPRYTTTMTTTTEHSQDGDRTYARDFHSQRISPHYTTMEYNQDGVRAFGRDYHSQRISPRYTTTMTTETSARDHHSPRISSRYTTEHFQDGVRDSARDRHGQRISPLFGENIDRLIEPYVPGSPTQILGTRHGRVDDGETFHHGHQRPTGPGPVADYAISNYEPELGSYMARRQQPEIDEMHGVRDDARHFAHTDIRDVNFSATRHLSGQDPSLPVCSYVPDPGFPGSSCLPDHGRQRGLLSSVYANASQAGMSPTGTMWSAGRHEELHRTSMSAFGTKPPLGVFDGNDRFDQRLPLLGHRPGLPPGFAPGPHQAYPHHSSGGWLE